MLSVDKDMEPLEHPILLLAWEAGINASEKGLAKSITANHGTILGFYDPEIMSKNDSYRWQKQTNLWLNVNCRFIHSD